MPPYARARFPGPETGCSDELPSPAAPATGAFGVLA